MSLLIRTDSPETIEKEYTKELVNSTRDILTTRTSISPDKYPDIFTGLIKYSEGSSISVTYFRRYGGYLNKQSEDYSFSLLKSDVSLSYDKIYNLPIILKDPLETSFDAETGETTIEGTGYLYPRTDPRIGDIFLYTLQDNSIGLFIINNIERLSISSNTKFEISFHLYSFTTQEILDKLETNVREIYYFDKAKYMEDDVILLKQDDYQTLVKIKKLERQLPTQYILEYYNKASYTLLYKNEAAIPETTIYDPYIIEFLHNTIDVTDSQKSVKQLFGHKVDYNYEASIWNAISRRNINLLRYFYNAIAIVKPTIYDAHVTSGTELCHVEIGTEEIPVVREFGTDITPYIFKEEFYTLVLQIQNVDIHTTNDLINSAEWNLLDNMEKGILLYFLVEDVYTSDTLNEIISPLVLESDFYITLDKKLHFYYMIFRIFFLSIAKRIIK